MTDLSRSIQIPGQPVLTVARTIRYDLGPTAEEQRCQDMAGSGSCAPEWTWGRQADLTISSSIDNGVADQDVWMWADVPAAASYVTYVDGGVRMWQRPIAGFAAFPNVAGHSEVVNALDADGIVIGTPSWPGAGGWPGPLNADVDTAQYAELSDLTASTMRTCLTDAGGDFAGLNVASFPAGVDQSQVWVQCANNTKSVFGARVAEMNVRTSDPATAKAENPNSPLRYGP